MAYHGVLVALALGRQEVGDSERHLWIGEVIGPRGLAVIRQVNERDSRRVTQTLGDSGPVLALSKQAVEKRHTRSCGSQLRAVETVLRHVCFHGRRWRHLVC